MNLNFLIGFVLLSSAFGEIFQPEGVPVNIPRVYKVSKLSLPLAMDGKLNEQGWEKASWTEDFVDIEGEKKPLPLYRTRVKMLYDDHCLYIGAELEEPDLWATYTEEESILYHENDFEVFIDPDGDGKLYYELEINALNTKWDLLMTRPYKDGGIYISAWEIKGLKKGVFLDGTLNDPSDRDRYWSVELALPWDVLKECAPGRRKPGPGDTWRINFSRVQWRTKAVNGKYEKEKNPETGKVLPEFNWVWTPQGVINMHQPETWGFLEFCE